MSRVDGRKTYDIDKNIYSYMCVGLCGDYGV
jgi:hypothetical protein